jgi:iron complex outermembrane receptor protein
LLSLRTALQAALLLIGPALGGGERVLADTGNAAAASAALPGSSTELSTIVVTATRAPASSDELPVSIDRIDEREISQGQLQVNLSETLDAIPGVSAQMRQNYAQDLQLSIRGFGARSEFGVRGVRLYSDGIPGTMPDGQGQFSQFDLGSAEHIEVMRGPFSALYGNSSGGVVAVFTRDGVPGSEVEGSIEEGSFATQRYGVIADGADGNVNYLVDVSHFQTNGYRDHSAAERNILNSKVRIDLDNLSRLTLVVNAITSPSSQDPLGLTRAQFAADPTQAGTNAIAYNSRKSLDNEQVGAIYERDLSESDTLQAMLYGGHRATTQFQAIPASTEGSPANPGGVIALNRFFGGTDVHLTDRRTLLDQPLQTTAGVSYDNLEEHRQGFTNFIGDELGVEGELRRHENNRVYDLDEYLQTQWDPFDRWRAIAGVRNSVVEVASHSLLVIPGTSPESGVRYAATNPVAGVTFRALDQLHLYGSYGRGFETPTLNDLAYRSTNGSIPGLNLGLKPARSDNYELGVKAGDARLHADLAAFYVQTDDELAVQADAAGRSVYENIGETRRKGFEAALNAQLGAGFSSRVAYTYIDAVTEQPYTTCVGAPCKEVLIPPGSHLPAVPEDSLYAALSWGYVPQGFTATLEAISRAEIFADDRNSQAAAGYTIFNLRFGLEQQPPHWDFTEYVRIDNLGNRNYVGSVIVNETNMRFYEPEPGRTFDLMFTIALRD